MQDPDRGGPTGIDGLNGAIVWLAQAAGVKAPVNALITELVHEHERADGPPRFLSPPALRARIASCL